MDLWLSRAKAVEGGYWVQGQVFPHLIRTPDFGEPWEQFKYQYFIIWEVGSEPGEEPEVRLTEVDYETIGRCTGLVDVNGVLIFDGDFVLDKYGVVSLVTLCRSCLRYEIRAPDGGHEGEAGAVVHHLNSRLNENLKLEVLGNRIDSPNTWDINFRAGRLNLIENISKREAAEAVG